MASLMGLRMAASRPAASAMVRNAALTVSRWGRPKEMFETPSTVRTPSSCLQRRSASSVTRALSDPVEMVIVSASSTRFRRGMPRSSAARTMRRAISTRPSAVSGMPPSSSGRPTTTPPYFLARGRTFSRDSRLPDTELSSGIPLQRRSAASMAAGLAVSICTGRSQTACTACTAAGSSASSSMSGRPTLTSSTSAPRSACCTASCCKRPMSRLRSARLRRGLPVGLIRSPMTMGARDRSTARLPEVTTGPPAFLGRGFGAISRQAAAMAAMCAGVVPQQPPTIHAPAPQISAIAAANSSGLTS